MNKKGFFRFCFLLFTLFYSLYAKEIEAELLQVDTALVYREDGRADISIKSSWDFGSSSKNSFYFSGEKTPIQFNAEKSWAEGIINNKKQKFPLECVPLQNGAYDIIISNGIYLSGRVEFMLSYRVNLAISGQAALVYAKTNEETIENTKKNQDALTESRFFYFNWATVEWEFPLKSRTTHIVLPISLSDLKTDELIEDTLSEQKNMSKAAEKEHFIETLSLQILSETFLSNTKYEPYFIIGSDQKEYLVLRFVQENLNPRESQKIQFYFNADSKILNNSSMVKPSLLMDKTEDFPIEKLIKNEVETNEKKDLSWLFFLLFILLFLALSLVIFLILIKKRKLKKQKDRDAALKILTSRLKTNKTEVEHKILHPIQVAFLLEFPIEDFLYLVLESLYLDQKISFQDNNELTIKKLVENYDAFEKSFLSCFLETGIISYPKFKQFYKKGMAKNFSLNNFENQKKQNKEALKNYWEKMLKNYASFEDTKLKEEKYFSTYWLVFSLHLSSQDKDFFYADIFTSPLFKKTRDFVFQQ